MSCFEAIGVAPTRDAAFDAILALLRERTGTDFSRYRPSTLARRIANRMISVGAQSFEQYLGVLAAEEQEPLRLLERVTIKVSRFYRNSVTFDALRERVIPQLVREREGAPLRIWSAGCGCGEEPYTLAMLLEEAGAPGHIEASDLDPAALAAAHKADYCEAAFSELPQALRERYVQPRAARFAVSDDVRARVRFSRHDLTAHIPPPGEQGEFDLVCCRNVLIYFERETQEAALEAIRHAVAPHGYLCLGEAEWPSPAAALTLEALSHRTRIFRSRATVATGLLL